MAETFGVTTSLLQQTHFPHNGAFTPYGTPSSTVVAAIIARKAARVAGRLQKEGIEPAVVAQDPESNAYLLAQELVLREARIDVAPLVSGITSEDIAVAKSDLRALYEELDDNGWTALGTAEPTDDGSAPVDGPQSHLDNADVEVEESDDVSSVVHKLRARDHL